MALSNTDSASPDERHLKTEAQVEKSEGPQSVRYSSKDLLIGRKLR
jgi:hypothetical protein